ncbi:hypothetical protein DFH07DRAFT_783908 [Mycena maculata]|uniref:Uncharacterized protein n=1 Tax=Mycena maculata TaxID=230809 RepID=A0AAD7HJN6_9AGAR|nr:hypothetical protein DFH07DRAFT_783908 [Mycena maculata]
MNGLCQLCIQSREEDHIPSCIVIQSESDIPQNLPIYPRVEVVKHGYYTLSGQWNRVLEEARQKGDIQVVFDGRALWASESWKNIPRAALSFHIHIVLGVLSWVDNLSDNIEIRLWRNIQLVSILKPSSFTIEGTDNLFYATLLRRFSAPTLEPKTPCTVGDKIETVAWQPGEKTAMKLKPVLRSSFVTTVAAVVAAAVEDGASDLVVAGDVREDQKVDGTRGHAAATGKDDRLMIISVKSTGVMFGSLPLVERGLQQPKNTKDTGKIVAKEYPSNDLDIHHGAMHRWRPENQFTSEPEQHFE